MATGARADGQSDTAVLATFFPDDSRFRALDEPRTLLESYSAWVQEGHDAAAFREMLIDWKNRGTPTTSKAGTLLPD